MFDVGAGRAETNAQIGIEEVVAGAGGTVGAVEAGLAVGRTRLAGPVCL